MNVLFKKRIGNLAAVSSILLMLFFFNNCNSRLESTASSPPGADSNSGSTTGLCEDELKNLYARSWHQFLKTNCAICHSNGPGKGRFANADVNIAYDEFTQIGYSKISSNAVNPAHNAPYSGVQHTEAINTLKVEWQTGVLENAKCSGATTDVSPVSQAEKITLRTTDALIGLTKDGDKKVLIWTVNSDLQRVKGTEAPPNIAGAKIAITVTRHKNSAGATYYDFTAPTLFDAAVDVRVQGIFINLNGFLLKYPTTFSYVDKNIRQNSKNDLSGLLSFGSLATPKAVVPTDTVSLSFIDISQVSLPPLPPPVTVNLLSAKVLVVPKNTEFHDFTIALSSPAVEPVIVTISENNDLCGTAITYTNANTQFKTVSPTCLKEVHDVVCPSGSCSAAAKEFGRAKSVVGTTWNRFDWDYKFPVNTVSFNIGESTKTLRVYFSKDIRLEKNRVLTFDITSVLGLVVVGSNKTTSFVLNKFDNPTPNANILTLTELMNESAGILGQNCVKCHNSAKIAGGYDMTNYDWMIKNRVVVPNDVNSKMYVRMHDTGASLVKPMPFDGFLPAAMILEVEHWLLNGALNN